LRPVEQLGQRREKQRANHLIHERPLQQALKGRIDQTETAQRIERQILGRGPQDPGTDRFKTGVQACSRKHAVYGARGRGQRFC